MDFDDYQLWTWVEFYVPMLPGRTHTMKIFFKALLAPTALVALVLAGGAAWFYLYSGDIPNFTTLAKFAPAAPVTVISECSAGSIPVIPDLGKTLQGAIRAAERTDDMLAFHIATRLFCDYRGGVLRRHLMEYKASVQLRHRLTPDQLLTIYANGAYFGEDVFGVEAASEHFYSKHAAELDVPQSAMIAGLIQSPRTYSPERHPENAKKRRDHVIDGMVTQGAITTSQAEAAKATLVVH